MTQSILILEDNADRRAVMRDWVCDRLHMYDLVMTDDPAEFLAATQERAGHVLVASLDHDLYERADGSTELTGMMVVNGLVRMPPAFPVVLHTSNQIDGERMRSRLERNGWGVEWVVPFDGTNWIATDWYPTLKKAIRRTATREAAPVDDRD